jgi:hypothetical protein
MFEDLEEEAPDVTPESPDRAIVWAIYSRDESAGLTPEEAWAILHERYPDDARFLLLNAYAELVETRRLATAEAPSAGYFLKKVEKCVGGSAEALLSPLRDLLLFAGALLAGVKDDDAALLATLRGKVAGAGDTEAKRDERDRAGLRLRRFEREVVKELHDRTEDGKALGVRAAAAPPPSPANDWAAAVADQAKARRKYAADARFARGELVEHPKFGLGVVTGTEPGKAVILFESGVRKLVAGA